MPVWGAPVECLMVKPYIALVSMLVGLDSKRSHWALWVYSTEGRMEILPCLNTNKSGTDKVNAITSTMDEAIQSKGVISVYYSMATREIRFIKVEQCDA